MGLQGGDQRIEVAHAVTVVAEPRVLGEVRYA
jgi:protein required for attachment to host cells